MRQLLVFTAFIFLLVCSCKKPEADDLSGTYEIKGTLVVNDTTTGFSNETILKDHFVQIKNPEDSATQNYLFQVKSDALGNFHFTNLSGRKYLLYAEKEVNGLLMTSRTLINPDTVTKSIKLVLYPSYANTNVLSVLTKDAASNGILGKVSVCVFGSSLLARNGSCNGALWSGETNEQGKKSFPKLTPGLYFINAQTTVGNITLKARDSILVGATGIFQSTLMLNADTLTGELSFKGLVYYDPLGTTSPDRPLADQTLQLKRLEDSTNLNTIVTVKTSSSGSFTFPGLAARDYYLYTEKEIDGVPYIWKGIINPATANNVKIVLYPDTLRYPVLSITTKDNLTNGILNTTTVCVFTNSLLAAANQCSGSIINRSTNEYGVLNLSGLPAGWYYINAQKTTDSLKLTGRDSILLGTNGLYPLTIFLKE